MKAFLTCVLVAVLWLPQGSWAQLVNNPLVKPAPMSQAEPAVKQQDSATSAAAAENEAELARRAAGRLTQEDFSIEQQRLNSARVPLPLSQMMEGLSLVAFYQNAAVLRKLDNTQPVPAADATQNGNSGRVGGSANVSGLRALRLRVGQLTNVNGYQLVARLQGQAIAVDWVDEKSGRSINVFFDSLQGGSRLLPDQPSIKLESVTTEQFDYLRPRLGGTGGSSSSSSSSGSDSSNSSSSTTSGSTSSTTTN
ncbi:MAG: hypothetical protein HC848_02035 [Limnobacter sp.]|nr:hypothetical protein [Limnobacter sp.]